MSGLKLWRPSCDSNREERKEKETRGESEDEWKKCLERGRGNADSEIKE